MVCCLLRKDKIVMLPVHQVLLRTLIGFYLLIKLEFRGVISEVDIRITLRQRYVFLNLLKRKYYVIFCKIVYYTRLKKIYI